MKRITSLLVALIVAMCMTNNYAYAGYNDYDYDSYYDYNDYDYDSYYDYNDYDYDGYYDYNDYDYNDYDYDGYYDYNDYGYNDYGYNDYGYNDYNDYGYDGYYDYGYNDNDYNDYDGYNDYSYDIVVDIEFQKISVYQGEEVVFCDDVVTGTFGVSDTPKGTYQIYGMYEDLEISPGYYSSYWMPFAGDIGLHDADEWRKASEYGGDTYLTEGSHGCVNLPYYAARKIYEEYAEIGTVVIVK